MPQQRGTNTLITGLVGSGKTYSLSTIIEAGLDLAVIITDPGGEETLIEAMQKKGLSMDKLFIKYIPIAGISWETMIKIGQQVNVQSYKDLGDQKYGIETQKHQQFLEVLKTLANFKDDLTGRELGPVDEWGPDKCIAIDGFTGINKMALSLMVGGKPAPHMGEWGVAMNMEEKLIDKLCSDTKCFFVGIAHLEPFFDESQGKKELMPAFLGSKLAPKIPRLFSDVVQAIQEDGKYYWATTSNTVALKHRNLQPSGKLPPTFKPIYTTWKKRQIEEGPNDVNISTQAAPGTVIPLKK